MEENILLQKATNLYYSITEKGITNIFLAYDSFLDIIYITGFGYRDIITKDNIDTKLNSIDNEFEKWYCRWIDAYNDELEENNYTNGGYRK